MSRWCPSVGPRSFPTLTPVTGWVRSRRRAAASRGPPSAACGAAGTPPAARLRPGPHRQTRDIRSERTANDRGRRREYMPVTGINARQIEAFNKEYKASPQSFTLGLEAKTIWEGRGLGNLGKVALSSCVTEAIALNCARVGVNLKGLEVKSSIDVDPGPLTGAKAPDDWQRTRKTVKVEVIAKGALSKTDEQVIEEGG